MGAPTAIATPELAGQNRCDVTAHTSFVNLALSREPEPIQDLLRLFGTDHDPRAVPDLRAQHVHCQVAGRPSLPP